MTNIITPYVLQYTQEFWNLPSRGLYHELISAIISQKISFNQSRMIRSRLYNLINSDTFTFENIQMLSYELMLQSGLDINKINLIKSITENHDIMNTTGIGIWTINTIKIRCYPEYYPDILLVEDLWIRNHLERIFNTKLTISSAKIYQNQWPGYSTYISKFLWRITKEGIQRLLNGQVLTKQDFI